MKRSIFLLLAVTTVSVLAGCTGASVTEETTETRDLADFERVEISGSAHVVLSSGETQVVTITGLETYIEATTTEVVDNMLHIGTTQFMGFGVSVRTVTPSVAEMFGLAVDEGVLVVEVAVNSPAEEGGIQQGDVIVSLGQTEVTNTSDLQRAIHSAEIGGQIDVVYWRDGNQRTTRVTLVESFPPE